MSGYELFECPSYLANSETQQSHQHISNCKTPTQHTTH